tara:strand:- start:348 stop:692 length:345 start_codon:yes stop_codon:yes gene_type:complete
MRKIDKPWGYELIWAETKDYVAKIIFIAPGHRLSKQYHQEKEETVHVLEGTLVNVGEDNKETWLSPGQSFHVTPGQVHRFCATKNDYVKIVEVSTPHLDDVVRLEDDYRRIASD